MNTIHKQKGGTCIGFALINGIEHKGRRKLAPQAVYDFYSLCNIDTNEENKPLRILQMAKLRGIGGYKIKNPKIFYSQKLKIKSKKEFIKSLVKRIQSSEMAVMFGMNLREGKDKIPLDRNYRFKPNLKKPFRKGGHQVYVLDAGFQPNGEAFFVIENSWGSDWGDDGCFIILEPAFWSEVGEAYSVGLK